MALTQDEITKKIITAASGIADHFEREGVSPGIIPSALSLALVMSIETLFAGESEGAQMTCEERAKCFEAMERVAGMAKVRWSPESVGN